MLPECKLVCPALTTPEKKKKIVSLIVALFLNLIKLLGRSCLMCALELYCKYSKSWPLSLADLSANYPLPPFDVDRQAAA